VNKEQRLVRYLSSVYKVNEPKVISIKSELSYYEDNKIYLSNKVKNEERFYTLIHEFVHHLTGYLHDRVNINKREEREFELKVASVYYTTLLTMSNEDYKQWFKEDKDISKIEHDLYELMIDL